MLKTLLTNIRAKEMMTRTFIPVAPAGGVESKYDAQVGQRRRLATKIS